MIGAADQIERTSKTLEERGIAGDSFFVVTFIDGSSVTEKDVDWSSVAEERRVEYFEGTKTVFLCTMPVSRIYARHGDLEASIDVPEGCQAFQAIRSEAVLSSLAEKKTVCIGRTIGIVNDGIVIEEKFLNGVEHIVNGTKK